jgi:hypothetical protein
VIKTTSLVKVTHFVLYRNMSGTDLDDSQDMKKLLSMDYQREWLSNKSAEYTKEMKAQLVSSLSSAYTI